MISSIHTFIKYVYTHLASNYVGHTKETNGLRISKTSEHEIYEYLVTAYMIC